MSITFAIIIVTAVTSIRAFQRQELVNYMIFSPYHVKRNRQWHRFFTSGLLHANWMHLILNMYVLYIFGRYTEANFEQYFGMAGRWFYLLMYVIGIGVSELYSYFKHQDNPNYASLGASGAVSGVLFASILFQPWSGIGIIFIPFFIPAFVFGPLYLVYSAYMSRRGGDNIGHDAHFYGAIFGFFFPVLLKPSLLMAFVQSILHGS